MHVMFLAHFKEVLGHTFEPQQRENANKVLYVTICRNYLCNLLYMNWMYLVKG